MPSISDAVRNDATGWAQVADIIAQTGLREQQIEESKAQTQQRLLAVLAGKQELQDNADYRKAMLAGAALPIGGSAGIPGVTSAEEKGPPSIAATRDIETDPNTLMMRQLQKDKAYIANNLQLAKQFNQKDAGKWITALDSVNTQLREASAAVSKIKAENFKEGAQILANIDSPQGADAALRHIADTFGPPAATDIYKRLEVNSTDGQVLWNDANKRVFDQYRGQFTSMHEQSSIKNAAQTYDLNERKATEQAAHNRATELHGDQVVATSRDAIAHADARNAARLRDKQSGRDQFYTMTGMKNERIVSDKDQDRINQIAKDYKIEDYQKTAQVAERIEAKLTDPKQGFNAVNPVEARTLVDQYKQLVNNYRAHASGKYQESEISRMNGIMQKMSKWAESIGRGDSLLDKNTMLQLTQEVKTLAADRNADMVRQELNILQNTNQRGGMATWITRRGDLEAAIASGRAKRVKLPDGAEAVAIPQRGAKVTANDIYPLPTAPAGRANRFLMPPTGGGGEDE